MPPSGVVLWTGRVVEAGALGILVLAPWLFGAVEPWAQMALFCAVALLFAALIVWAPAAGQRLSLAPGWLPATFLLAWLAFQAFPIPSGLVALLSPERLRLEQQAALLLGRPSPSWLAISVDPGLTRLYLWEFAGVALYVVLLWNVVTDRKKLRLLLFAILFNGVALTLFAIMQRATWNGAIYWVRPVKGGDTFGPYVNRTHMGGLLSLIIPLGLGFLWAESARRNGERPWDWRSFVRMSIPDLFERFFLPLLLLLMAAGVLTSKSRGAMATLLLALALMALWFAAQGREGRSGFLGIAGFLAAGLLFALWMAADLFLGATERLAGEALDAKESSRLAIWSQALGLWRRFPLAGSGMGTFEPAFNLVRRVFPGNHAVTHAESDYVQLLCDTGSIGVGLALWLFLALVFAGWRALAHADGRSRQRVILGGLIAVVAAALQGIANFDLSIMANWLYVAAAVVVMGKAGEVGVANGDRHVPHQGRLRDR